MNNSELDILPGGCPWIKKLNGHRKIKVIDIVNMSLFLWAKPTKE